jgi:deoxyribodipyrimidine photo-lyase
LVRGIVKSVTSDRIKLTNSKPVLLSGDYILYWIQEAQRVPYNYALEYALELSRKQQKPLALVFSLTAFPEANIRHYWFMYQGLLELKQTLKTMNLTFEIFHESPNSLIPKMANMATVLVTEKSYLKVPRTWKKTISAEIPCQMIEIETETVIPVETVSQKEEYAAATIRKKITSRWQNYLVPWSLPQQHGPGGISVAQYAPHSLIQTASIQTPEQLATKLNLSLSPEPSKTFHGGWSHGIHLFNQFLQEKFSDFGTKRSDPSLEIQSNLSPYLHFGMISPVEAAIKALEFWNQTLEISSVGFFQQTDPRPDDPLEAFLEELVVRRELGFNYCYYNSQYDSFEVLPNWAKQTLNDHELDPRPWTYSLQDFEQVRTHDPYWNAAMNEMIQTGKMAGYMRMYWGKKILEWTRNPREAYAIALYLNNKYFLDGRDPNSYAGVAWCFGKHDRPWTKRPIFGAVRYMNDKGLERKFAIKDYAKKWS